MPGSHWMIVSTPEHFAVTRARGFDLVGIRLRHRKKAERLAPGDRILHYVSRLRVFPATATVTGRYFEDRHPIWPREELPPELFPWRAPTRPDVILHDYEALDAHQIAPRLLYVKRWSPEDWPLAFQGQVHLLSAADFALVEQEMRRVVQRRGSRRERPPRRPREAGPTPGPGLVARA